jgi:TRAP transporter TAXI family solute receptor
MQGWRRARIAEAFVGGAAAGSHRTGTAWVVANGRIEGRKTMKTTFSTKRIAMALSLCAALMSPAAANAQETLRWGTSALGSTVQIAVQAIASIVNAAQTDIKIQEQTTSGPVENMRLLYQGELEVVQSTENTAWDAYFGKGIFEAEGKANVLGLFTLYPTNVTFAVGVDSGIKSVADLKGKRLAIGPAGTGVSFMMEEWLKAYGIADQATLLKLGYSDGTNGLTTGAVDAALVYIAAGKPVSFLQELDLASDITLLPWDVSGPEYAALAKERPEMAAHDVIPAGMTRNLKEDIEAPVLSSLQYVSGKVSEKAVYTLMKSLWDNRAKITERAALLSWAAQDPRNLLAGLVPQIAIHPGAVKFYKEVGVWDDRFSVGQVQQ